MIKLKCNACDGACDNEMDVRFGTKCDNNCPFCITRNRGRKPYTMNVDKMIESTIEEGHRSCINIVGGEPLLHDNLENLKKYIEGVRNITDNITIITSLPYISPEDQPLFFNIMEMVDDLVVSIQHYDPAKNNYLMRASDDYDRIDFLRELSKTGKLDGKLNVTINLSKDGINSQKELETALKLFDSIGVKYARLNELTCTPQHIGIKEVLPKLKYKSPYAHGCSVNVIKQFRKLKLKCIKTIKIRLRCYLCSNEKPSWSDLIKFKIKAENIYKCEIENKPCKYLRQRNTVLYEDGHFELKYY